MSKLTLPPDDGRLSWPGAVSLQTGDGWVMPWRVPWPDLALFHPAMHLAASKSAGVRLAFRTDSREVVFETEPDPKPEPGLDPGRLDLCLDGRLTASEPVGGNRYAFAALPAGLKEVELWLSPSSPFRLRSVLVDDGAKIERTELRRPRWIAYGSSITQASAAGSPTRTWTAMVAAARGLDLANLGYGGQCHLDPPVARMIRDLPADFISICSGINIQGQSSFNARTYGPALTGFILTLRDGHPDAPLSVMSPIHSPGRETIKNSIGFTVQDIRRETAAVVGLLRSRGDPRLVYIDGLEILGADRAGRLPDRQHPDAEGNAIMARNFLAKAGPGLFGA
jgi:hypothetical protein